MTVLNTKPNTHREATSSLQDSPVAQAWFGLGYINNSNTRIFSNGGDW